jgi:imidazolonepropionase
MQHNAQPYGQLSESVVALHKGVIAGVFNADAIHSLSARTMIDGQQQWLLPGFIDCHTHLVYGGNRANEFEMCLQGVSYKDIAL